MYHLFLIHSFADEHADFFPVLLIVNSAAMNTGMCVSFFIMAFSKSFAGVGFLGHMTVLFLVLWGTSILFSIATVPVYIPINSVGRFPFLHTLFSTYYFFLFFFICSEFCPTLEWNSHGFTYVPHPDPPSHLPLHPLPLDFPSAPGPSACLMHPTWAGNLFHPRYYTCFDAVLLKHPTLSFSHRV